MLSRVVSCFFVLSRVALVLSRVVSCCTCVVSCCTRVVLCFFVSPRVVTLVVF